MRARPDVSLSRKSDLSTAIGWTAAHERGTLARRLANVERELRVQFTRIAQLQAELDRVLPILERTQSAARRQA